MKKTNRVLPILFNTDMVQAILDGRKTATRRVIKPQPDEKHNYPLGFITDSTEKKDIGSFCFGLDEYSCSVQFAKPPYRVGDVLYVRETWCKDKCRYMYRADYGKDEKFYRNGKEVQIKWCPSIHMPKEAARIWLKVTDVRVERLQDISEDTPSPNNQVIKEGFRYNTDFAASWNVTIKKSDKNKYGWYANPWVWVIEFERTEKPEPCILDNVEPAQDKRPCIGYSISDIDDEPCEMCKKCKYCTGNDEYDLEEK